MIDRKSWSKAWQLLGAKDGGDELHKKLVQCWSEGHRHYHTLQHLQECFGHLTGVEIDEKDAAAIAVALWFHDAFYDPKRDDNELRSADWLHGEARGSGMTMATAQRLHDLVMATKHETMPDDDDTRLLVDIDLSILGAERDRFEESDVQIRREYAHVPEPEWKVARKRMLRGFLDRERLYGTQRHYSALEVRARENLQRALERLDA